MISCLIFVLRSNQFTISVGRLAIVQVSMGLSVHLYHFWYPGYIYMYMYIYIYIYVCIYVYIYVCVCVCVQARRIGALCVIL